MKTHRTLAISAAFLFLAIAAGAADWPNYRGPNFDGISTETDLDPSALATPKIAWQTEIGIGFSSVSVANGKAYVMGNLNKKTDVVYCFDALTGKELWRHEYAEPLEPKNHEGGPTATPTVHKDKVYTLSKTGKVFCLDAETGKPLWNQTLPYKTPTWHFSSSGLVLDDKIIFNVGAAGVALSLNDGQIVWQSDKGDCGYATPVSFKAPDGQTLVAIFGKDTLMAIDPADGKLQWSFPWKTQYDINAADPIIVGDELLITSGYNHGAALIRIANPPTVVWENKNLRSQMSGPVRIGEYVYGIDQNQLACLEWKTGKQIWTEGKVGNGSVSAAGDKLIVLSEKGRLMIVEASPDGFKELSGSDVLSGRCWTMPIVANGYIYARNAQGHLVCVDVRLQKIVALVETADAPAPQQWPQWKGPTRNNKSTETGLLKQWPEGGPKQLWTADGLGQGFSTVAVADGKIYTTGAIEKEGVLFCLNMDGKPLWQQSYGPEWSRATPGVRCTPTVNDGRVYVISGAGQVACFNAATGEKSWQVDPFTEYAGSYGIWGIAESPVIAGNKVIFTVGGKETLLVALDKATGKTVWTTPGKGEKSAYCSPLAFEWAGKTLVAGMTEGSLFVVDAEDGKLHWSLPIGNYVPDNRRIHPVTPVFENGRLYFTSGYNMGGIQFQISEDGKTFTETWRDTVLDNHHGSVVLDKGFLYGANWIDNGNGDWICLDWNTGKVRYTQHWLNKGSLTFADGMLYCYEEGSGTVGLVPATPEGFNVVSSFVVTQGQDQHWAHPVVCGKRLYIRHGSVLAAYDIADPQAK